MLLRRVGLALILCVAGSACRRPIQTATVPLPANWSHCWWTAIRSTLPPDSVAARYRRAFVMAGLTSVKWTRSADTIWLRGGPAPVLHDEANPFDSVQAGETFWVRVAVFPQKDSSHFRLYVAIVAPPRGWAHPGDSSDLASRQTFPVCEAIARAADVRWIRRSGDPGDEEKLPVWSRIP
jgi:hypothetical protein